MALLSKKKIKIFALDIYQNKMISASLKSLYILQKLTQSVLTCCNKMNLFSFEIQST